MKSAQLGKNHLVRLSGRHPQFPKHLAGQKVTFKVLPTYLYYSLFLANQDFCLKCIKKGRAVSGSAPHL
jgi:hypothetical protein